MNEQTKIYVIILACAVLINKVNKKYFKAGSSLIDINIVSCFVWN